MGSLFSGPETTSAKKIGKIQNKQNTQNAYQNAAFNRVNQQDQYGNQLSYQQTGKDANGNPIFNASQSLGQTGQQFAGGLGAIGQQYFQGAQNLLNNPADYTNAGVEARINELGARRLDPRFQREGDALHTQLVNRGLDPTSEAYKAQMEQFGQTKNDAYNQLALQGRGQAFDEALRGRSAQIEELQGLTAPGLRYGMNAISPNLINAPGVNVGNVDMAGLYGQQNAQNVAQHNAMLGGLASVAGTGAQMFMMSDRRMKRDITLVGKAANGLNVYDFRYIGGDDTVYRGFMADEVRAVNPEAVVTIGGIDHVDMAKAAR
jgi:hypothetical protein